MQKIIIFQIQILICQKKILHLKIQNKFNKKIIIINI